MECKIEILYLISLPELFLVVFTLNTCLSFSDQVSLPLIVNLDDVGVIADTSESVTLTCVASYSPRQPSGYSWSKDGAGLPNTASSLTIPYNNASNIYSNSCTRKLTSASGVQCNSTYQCSASLSGIQGSHLTTANVIVSLSKQQFVRTLERLFACIVNVKINLIYGITQFSITNII